MNRPNENDYYLNIAREVATRSTCIKRQYGAVIVNNKEIIATGYNGSVRGAINCCDINMCPRLNEPHNSGNYGNCKSVHAEQNALLSASRRDMLGGTLYLVGLEDGKEIDDVMPCPVCMKLIINSGLDYLVTRNNMIKTLSYIKNI